MKKIMIDAGHGGDKFTGATALLGAEEIRECDLNLGASILLANNLQAMGHTTLLTREIDKNFKPTVTEDLQERCNIEHTWEPDCFISVHCNAASNKNAHGFEIWTSPGQTDADPLAEDIYWQVQEMNNSPKMRSDILDGDHDREEHLYVLDHTKSPAVLLELDFMSNPDALKKLCSAEYLTKLMQTVAKGTNIWLANRQ